MIRKRKIEWYLALFALLTIILSWWIGKQANNEDQSRILNGFFPEETYSVKPIDENVFKLTSGNNNLLNYLTISTGRGYGGPIQLLVHFDTSNTIKNIWIIDSKETASYLRKVINNEYLIAFQNKSIQHFSKNKFSPDAISGATKTCEGIKESVIVSVKNLAKARQIPVLFPEDNTNITVGYKEVLVLLLFILGILGRIKNFRYKKPITWISLITGMIFLGFIVNQPITITRINSLLMGYWPEWQNELYVYLLIFGIIIILLTTGKNVYCNSICPFGAVQELLAKTGKAGKIKFRYHGFQIWLQRSLAWAAILMALIFREPSITEYEVYSSLFQFTSSAWLFILLAVVIIVSLIIYRPWCHYLCPINPVFGILKLFRSKTLKLFNWK